MLTAEKFSKFKIRLIIGVVTGLTAVLVYVQVAGIKPVKMIGFSNIIAAAWISVRLLEVFLLFSALGFTLISAIILFTKHKSRQIFYSFIAGLAVILMVIIPEISIRHRLNLYKKINDKSLSTLQIVDLFEKVTKKGNVKALSLVAVHPNLPDTIIVRLSESEHMEVRRSIAWTTDSEEVLKKLSLNKEWEVRMAVATNKFTPLQILYTLQNDTNAYVKNAAYSMIQQKD